MDEKQLKESLAQLRAEIHRLEAGDDQARERLNGLVADIERRLSHPDREVHDSLMANLRSAIEHFEVAHPRATGILNHIMVTLGNMGI